MTTTGSTIGKYALGRKLGQGSFGLVYVARDTSLDREVAIKLVHPSLTATADVMRRFVNEARSAAKIVHPGIVTVYDCGQLDSGVAYIAMEILHGETLADRLARAGRLPPENATEIARQIASALEAAHRAGVIHRDLKPDNIFLAKDPAMPEGERVKILDFGIAKLAGAATSMQTQSGMVFGTPRYMSPEQCRSAANIDHRSDIYTLGCILFELLAGAPPFDGDIGIVMAKHVMIDPPTLRSRIAISLPAHLEPLIASMLAKDPEKRPPSMAAVQQALEATASPRGIAPTIGTHVVSLPLPIRAPVPSTMGVASGESQTASPRPRSLRRRLAVIVGGGAIIGACAALGLLALRPDPTPPAVVLAAPPAVVLPAKPSPPSEPPRAPDPPPPPAPVAEPVRAKPPRVAKRHKPAPVAPVETPECDADAFAKTGQAAYVAGNYTTALRAFESALECKPSQSTAAKVAMAACRAGSAAKAQHAWRALTPQSKKLVEPICAQGGIVFDPPPVT